MTVPKRPVLTGSRWSWVKRKRVIFPCSLACALLLMAQTTALTGTGRVLLLRLSVFGTSPAEEAALAASAAEAAAAAQERAYRSWWKEVWTTGAPPATVPLLPCDQYVKQEKRLSNHAIGVLLSQYYPGDCRLVDPPEAIDLCRPGSPMVERAFDCYPELWEHCEAKRRAANSSVPVRLCTHEGMPAFVRHGVFAQRYEYAHSRAALEADVGFGCTQTRVGVMSMGFFHQGGPRKVIHNLASSLRAVGQPYVINPRRLDRLQAVWSCDPHAAALTLTDAAAHLRVFHGPTLTGQSEPDGFWQFPLMRQPMVRRQHYMVASSVWQGRKLKAEEWHKNGNFAKMRIWPTGVDEKLFSGPFGNGSRAHIPRPWLAHVAHSTPYILYKKQRGECRTGLLVEQALRGKKSLKRLLFGYGKYTEEDYKAALDKAAFAVVIADSETQGFAIEEMMATGIPMVISKCEPGPFGASSVPYWSPEVGIVVDPRQRSTAIQTQVENFLEAAQAGIYTPRAFIERELSLAAGAIDFMRIVCGRRSRWTPEEEYEREAREDEAERNATAAAHALLAAPLEGNRVLRA